MRCSSCDLEIVDNSKFCQECGARQLASCAGCGTSLPPSAKFCPECGHATSEVPATATTGSSPASSSASPPASAIPTATQAPEPGTSFASGRYRIERLLGEGAKKRVYLARDTLIDREVALALVKGEGLDEGGRLRVRREAQAMGQLGDHANVVTVYDVGQEGDQLYIVTQYMSSRVVGPSPELETSARTTTTSLLK